ncbi:MAG: hypothetical protein ACTSRZ_05835 [Promethearchaeota archaeon]
MDLKNKKTNILEQKTERKINIGVRNKFKNIFANLTDNFKKYFYHIFIRDFKIAKIEIFIQIIKSLILSILLSFLILIIAEDSLILQFSYNMQIAIFSVSGIFILLGGIITDSLMTRKHIFEIMALLTSIFIFIIVFARLESIIIIFSFLATISSACLCILFLTSILRITDLLNRARVIVFILSLMLIASAPIVSLIIAIDSKIWVPFLLLGFAFFLLYLNHKFQMEHEKYTHHFVQINIKDYFSVIKNSGGIPYIFYLFFTSFILGFFASSAIQASFKSEEIISVVIVGIISVPIIAAILDNIGRKSTAFIALFLIGIFCIFFDFPVSSPFQINPVRLAAYVYALLSILILAIVVPGDIASIYARGRILGVFLFSPLIGIVLGSWFQLSNFTTEDFLDRDLVSLISDFSSLIIFILIFLFSRVKDSFQKDSTNWRKYILRLYIISENGLSLYNKSFTSNIEQPSEDLVSGGLTGLQAILKEISMTEKEIESIQQEDISLIFHHGRYTKAVLFAKKELNVLKEKLAEFHVKFEKYNEKELKRWSGDVSSFLMLDELTNYYFT